jgi:transcriptional regulator with XRE-family HTH domain
MSQLAQRIRQRLDDLQMPQRQLAQRCGVSPPAVNDWISGKTKSLKAYTLLKASKALGVTPQWLESGVGVKFLRDDTRVTEAGRWQDPTLVQLQRVVEYMLPDDQKKLLEYAELLVTKRTQDQKKSAAKSSRDTKR